MALQRCSRALFMVSLWCLVLAACGDDAATPTRDAGAVGRVDAGVATSPDSSSAARGLDASTSGALRDAAKPEPTPASDAQGV
jgi:hypothetical protein